MAASNEGRYFPGFDDLVEDISFDDELYEPESDDESNATGSLRDSVLVGSETQTALQTDSLQAAMDNFAAAIDQSAIASSTGLPVRTPSAQYKGFIAEEYFKQTLKINALSEGVPDYSLGVYTNGCLPNGDMLSRIDMQTDIAILTRSHPWSEPLRESDWQSKMHNDASAYLKDLENVQYASVNFVGGAGQGVNDTISVTVNGKTIHSDSITPEQATIMADEAKAQSTRPYPKRKEKLDNLHSVELGRAAKTGAASGFISVAINEVIRLMRLSKDGKLTKEEFVKSVQNALFGSADGAIRAGAVNEAVFHFGRVLGKDLGAHSLDTVPVMAGANAAVNFAEDLYSCFIVGDIDADDLLCNTVENVFLSTASYGGGWAAEQIAKHVLLGSARGAAATGAAIGSSLGPIGIVVGSVVGSLVIGSCGQALVGTAQKDAFTAYASLIEDIDAHIELEGCERIYYFADTMSSLSDFRLSFKDLLPCYNLISDLKEYSLHQKAIHSVEEQLRSLVGSLDGRKKAALREIRSSHETRLHELNRSFEDQKKAMQAGYRDSMNTYIANCFARYAELCEVTACATEELRSELSARESEHSYVLTYMRHRNEINGELNELIRDLLSEEDDCGSLKPLLDRLSWFMGQDRLLVGRQYLSYEAALTLVSEDEPS